MSCSPTATAVFATVVTLKQWAAVRTCFEDTMVPPQYTLAVATATIAAIGVNSFGAAFVPPTIRL